MFSYNVYGEIFQHFNFLKVAKLEVNPSFHFDKSHWKGVSRDFISWSFKQSRCPISIGINNWLQKKLTRPQFGLMHSVGFWGLDPSSDLLHNQQTLQLLALSEMTCLRRSKSHPKQYGGVLEPVFCTLRKLLMQWP